MELEQALKDGIVFSKEYVGQIRDEAKQNRLKVEKITTDLEDFKKSTSINHQNQINELKNNNLVEKTMTEINSLVQKAGIKVDSSQIYQAGKTAEEAFTVFEEKNPDLFKKTNLNIAGLDLKDDPSASTLMNKSMVEIQKDPKARGLLGSVYQRLIAQDRQNRRR